MLSLVYLSTATRSVGDDDLAAILTSARTRNTGLGITGLLTHRDGRFLQLLEGPDEAVDSIYARIQDDPRHTDIHTLDRNDVIDRWFPDWSMAFEPHQEQSVQDLEGFSDFFTAQGRANERSAPSRTRALLHWFRTHPLAAPAASH